MRKDKEIAFSLRKEGKSYNEISRQLFIPKSTLSGWFADVTWSEGVKNNLNEALKEIHTDRIRNLSRERGENLERIYKEAREEAKKEFEILKLNPLFIAGLMLYWGEGDKGSRSRCSLSNSDPNMLRLFASFLEKVCGVEKAKIKAWILAYPDIDQVKALEFWSRMTLVWPGNFTKTIVIQGRSKSRTLPFGVCSIMVFSSYLKVKIVEWMKLLSHELTKQA